MLGAGKQYGVSLGLNISFLSRERTARVAVAAAAAAFCDLHRRTMGIHEASPGSLPYVTPPHTQTHTKNSYSTFYLF